MTEYTIVGAGIVGLYTAFQLIEELQVKPTEITILADYLPGDQSINYTSPWAGGNFSCISPSDAQTLKFDKYTYSNLHRVQKALGGPECGLDQLPSSEFWDTYPGDDKINSLSSYLTDFRVLKNSELVDGAAFGIAFKTWNFNCPEFLSNFQKHLESKGIKFVRKRLDHIAQAYSHKTKVVFNCSGIGARKLGGVEDKAVYPTRGQVVVIRAPHIKENRLRWGDDYATYIIPRPGSADELVLGGFIQKGNWTSDTFGSETEDILQRTTKLLPEIKEHPIEIIRVAAGLRPSRHGGTRIELENIEGKALIHNYGASGYGYQAGLGMGLQAINLLKEVQVRKMAAKL